MYVPPAAIVRTARRSRSGSSGLTSQPSAPLRFARWTSATRSSSTSTGMSGAVAGGRIQPQRHRHGDAAHRADLQVDHRDVERPAGVVALGHLPGDLAAVGAHRERRVPVAERGDDVVDEPGGVRGEQYVHVRQCTRLVRTPSEWPKRCRPTCASPARSWTSAASWGTSTHGRSPKSSVNVASSANSPSRIARSSARFDHSAAAAVSPAAAADSACADASADVPSPNAGWTRFTTPAIWPIPWSPSCPANQTASVIVSRRGEATTTNRVVVGAQQSDDVVGPLAEPALHAGERLEERDGVGEHVRADDPPDRPEHRLCRDVHDPHSPAGRQHQQAEQPVVEEPGEHAGRLEEVERVAGRRCVDDDEVEALVVMEQVQRLGRHVLLGAAQRRRHVAEERVGEDALGLGVVGRVAANDRVERRGRCRASSPTARRSARRVAVGSRADALDLRAARGRVRRPARARRRAGGPGRS